jgi:hypothetical protein
VNFIITQGLGSKLLVTQGYGPSAVAAAGEVILDLVSFERVQSDEGEFLHSSPDVLDLP